MSQKSRYQMEDESSDDEEFAQELEAVELGVPSEQKPKKTVFVNNKIALLSKLDEIKLPSSFPWIEKLDFTHTRPLDVDNAQDDLKREAAFYAATLANAQQAILQFDQARIPYKRPPDFFAEMIKPDSQMQRIKDSLLNEKARMDLSAARRKQKEQKKFAQEVHAEKLKERSKAKKNFVEGVKSAPRGPAEERSLVGPINEALREGKEQKEERQAGKQKKPKGKKRIAADKKYGYGGQTKRQKRNDSSSAADDSGYRPEKNKQNAAGFGSFKKGGRGGSGGRGGRGGFSRGGGSSRGGGRGGFGGKRGGKGASRPGKSKRDAKH